ncbi:MAG: hypothetical protein NT039_04535 [Candidatus Berkelbacteria bacterium]|nr:hypothetical protein [Candidatus Berkelbacteria bacterium]
MPKTFFRKIFKPDKERPFFPGQEKGEKVLFFTRRHPLSFLGLFLFSFFMVILPFLVYWIVIVFGIVDLSVTGEKIMIVLEGAYLLFVLGFFLAAWIDYYMDVMIVTNLRIIDITQNVLFSRTIAEANLTDIEDINAEVKGILPTLFHYGTIFVQTAGTARNFEFDSMPDPYGISKMIVDLHQKSLLEEEKKEAVEIGESFARARGREEEIGEKDIHQMAHGFTHRRKPQPTEFKQEDEKDNIAEKQQPKSQEYQESSGWKEMDNHVLPKENKPPTPPLQPQEEPKPEPKKEDDNSVSHDDLKKGGEAEF